MMTMMMNKTPPVNFYSVKKYFLVEAALNIMRHSQHRDMIPFHLSAWMTFCHYGLETMFKSRMKELQLSPKLQGVDCGEK